MAVEYPPVVHSPLFLLDYDGTLAPITEHPMTAYPYPGVRDLLSGLQVRYPLWIVTGRHLRDLAVLLGLPLQAIGLHGVQEARIGEEIMSRMPEDARVAVEALQQTVPEIEGAWVEDKEHTFTVHYRDVVEKAKARELLGAWLSELPETLHAIWGKDIVEPRPRGIDKGIAIQRIILEHSRHTPIYIGDDTTDEDAFRVLDGDAVTIKVGTGETAARYQLPDPEAVIAYLRQYLTSS